MDRHERCNGLLPRPQTSAKCETERRKFCWFMLFSLVERLVFWLLFSSSLNVVSEDFKGNEHFVNAKNAIFRS